MGHYTAHPNKTFQPLRTICVGENANTLRSDRRLGEEETLPQASKESRKSKSDQELESLPVEY